MTSEQLFFSHCGDPFGSGTSSKLVPQNIQSELANLKQITFEVTENCNLRCQYCGLGSYYSSEAKEELAYLDVSKATAIIDYLLNVFRSKANYSENRTVTLSFYGGEPLLNTPLIEKVINYAENSKARGISFRYSMTTNAMLLDKHMDMLVAKNFNLLISLDGNRIHHSYRTTKMGENSFTKVIQSINLLRRKYPDFFKKNVNFNSVIHNRNSVQEVFEYFKINFNKTPYLSELNTTGITKEMRQEFLQTYRNVNESLHQSENYEEIKDVLFLNEPTLKSLAFFIIHNSSNVFSRYGDLLSKNKTAQSIPTGTCYPFSRKIFITARGKILPCERISHKYALGEVTENGVNLDLVEIAEKYNSYFNKFTRMCDSCYNRGSCVQCIFQLDDLEEKHPLCYGYMDKTRFNQHVSGFMRMLEKNPEYYFRIIEDATFY